MVGSPLFGWQAKKARYRSLKLSWQKTGHFMAKWPDEIYSQPGPNLVPVFRDSAPDPSHRELLAPG